MCLSLADPHHLIQFRRNSPPRINTISVELLSLVLHFAAGGDKCGTDPLRAYHRNLRIIRLSAVCSHWRQIAIGDATLWRNISFSPSLLPTIGCAAVFLQRSRAASLTLTIWNMDSPENADAFESQELRDLLDALRRDSGRLTALVAIDPPDIVIEALNEPATKLVHLDIQIAQSRVVPRVFRGEMPHLEYLSISNPEGWRIQPFENLHTVHIAAPSWRRWRLSTLLDCLDARVPIKELHLTHFEHFEPESAAESGRTASLSSLNVLRLTFCNSPVILNHLEIPSYITLSIYGHFDQSEDIFAGLSESRNFLGILKAPQFLTVVFDVEKQVFEVEVMETDGVHVLIGAVSREGRFDRKWVLRSMSAVTRFTPLGGVRWLTAVIDEDRMPWVSWLSKFNRLSTIEARCPDPAELLNALTTFRSDAGNVICPSLRSLSIERNKRPTVEASLLRKCLEARASAGSTISHLNLNDLDWSVIPNAEFGAWEELINRTRLNSGWIQFRL